jgi:hypothetical protein
METMFSTPIAGIIRSQYTPATTSVSVWLERRKRAKHAYELRDAYLQVFATCNRASSDGSEGTEGTEESEAWKDLFKATSDEVVSTFKSEATESEGGQGPVPETFTISYKGVPIEFSVVEERVILVGRQPGCDIQLDTDNKSTSRLACIIYVVPSMNRLLFVDPGGLFGVSTVKREFSSRYPVESSTENDRRLLTFEIGEHVVLRLGYDTMVLNNKLCAVCMEREREIVFDGCKHYVCCTDCSRRCTSCPICRVPIDVGQARYEYAVQTNAALGRHRFTE